MSVKSYDSHTDRIGFFSSNKRGSADTVTYFDKYKNPEMTTNFFRSLLLWRR